MIATRSSASALRADAHRALRQEIAWPASRVIGIGHGTGRRTARSAVGRATAAVGPRSQRARIRRIEGAMVIGVERRVAATSARFAAATRRTGTRSSRAPTATRSVTVEQSIDDTTAIAGHHQAGQQAPQDETLHFQISLPLGWVSRRGGTRTPLEDVSGARAPEDILWCGGCPGMAGIIPGR